MIDARMQDATRRNVGTMRLVIQRVSRARILAGGPEEPVGHRRECGAMGPGLFVLVGLKTGDTSDDLDWLVHKVVHLRVFDDEPAAGDEGEGRRAPKMNRSVVEVGGSLAVVSEFTLYGDARRGHRPSWSAAMPIEEARTFWPLVEARFLATGIPCIFGRFQAMMTCEIIADGPVTLILDSEDRFRPR